jgi:hypothetical protein
MHSKTTSALAISVALTALLVSACGVGTASPTPAPPASTTGISELDAIVAAAVSGDPRALVPYLEFASIPCTTAEGLGGPPKCTAIEPAGTPVDVLPFLGPGEGSFLRESEMDTWSAPKLARLYAAYRVSDAVYSEDYYPAGEYALVFTGDGASLTAVTLQVSQGRIVRIDYGVSRPPQIPPAAVEEFLVSPP